MRPAWPSTTIVYTPGSDEELAAGSSAAFPPLSDVQRRLRVYRPPQKLTRVAMPKVRGWFVR